MSKPKFKRVPMEPTHEMLLAGQAAWSVDSCKRSSTLYRAMVAAAPPDSTVTDWCACGDGYPQDSWEAGFMAAMGKCENCVAADGD